MSPPNPNKQNFFHYTTTKKKRILAHKNFSFFFLFLFNCIIKVKPFFSFSFSLCMIFFFPLPLFNIAIPFFIIFFFIFIFYNKVNIFFSSQPVLVPGFPSTSISQRPIFFNSLYLFLQRYFNSFFFFHI